MNPLLQLDSLDHKILDYLTHDARTSYLEIARQCHVSGALIHQRVNKLRDAGIISNSSFIIVPKGLGYLSAAFVGIKVGLTSPHAQAHVLEKISQIPEVVECDHVTGKFSFFIKIYAKDNEHLKKILVDQIQSIPEVTATETFISLEEGFSRQLPAG